MLDAALWPQGFDLHVHVPQPRNGPVPVLVCVHGISRNSREHLAAFRAAAGEHLAIVAPHFARESFPNYQRLGLGKAELRADLVLDAALERLGRHAGLDPSRFHLFGFSGGAQFAHRYAMMYPARVRSLHLAAAGWYTYPDISVPWPRGLGGQGHTRQMAANLDRFLALPLHLYVGENDVERDPGLRQSRKLDRQQGLDRRERAERWAAHLRAMTPGPGGLPVVDVLPGAGHDLLEACTSARGGLADRVAHRCIAPAGAGVPPRAERAMTLRETTDPIDAGPRPAQGGGFR